MYLSPLWVPRDRRFWKKGKAAKIPISVFYFRSFPFYRFPPKNPLSKMQTSFHLEAFIQLCFISNALRFSSSNFHSECEAKFPGLFHWPTVFRSTNHRPRFNWVAANGSAAEVVITRAPGTDEIGLILKVRPGFHGLKSSRRRKSSLSMVKTFVSAFINPSTCEAKAQMKPQRTRDRVTSERN